MQSFLPKLLEKRCHWSRNKYGRPMQYFDEGKHVQEALLLFVANVILLYLPCPVQTILFTLQINSFSTILCEAKASTFSLITCFLFINLHQSSIPDWKHEWNILTYISLSSFASVTSIESRQLKQMSCLQMSQRRGALKNQAWHRAHEGRNLFRTRTPRFL